MVAADVPAQAQGIFDTIKNGWKIAVLNAAQQAVSYFCVKWLMTARCGWRLAVKDKVRLLTLRVGDYMAPRLVQMRAGTAIEQLGKGFGLDLCKIPDVKLDLALRVGLHYNYALGSEPNKPACNLTTFKENWSVVMLGLANMAMVKVALIPVKFSIVPCLFRIRIWESLSILLKKLIGWWLIRPGQLRRIE